MLRNSRLRWLLGLLAALALVAAACGDDSSSGDDGGDDAVLSSASDGARMPRHSGALRADGSGVRGLRQLVRRRRPGHNGRFCLLCRPARRALTITGPGEESGTYDSYVELVVGGIAEAQGLPEEEWVADLTTPRLPTTT